jgi:hypothetical protein
MQMAKRPAPTGRDPETRSRAEPWRLRKSRMTTADRQVAVPTTARERAPRRRPGGVSGDAGPRRPARTSPDAPRAAGAPRSGPEVVGRPAGPAGAAAAPAPERASGTRGSSNGIDRSPGGSRSGPWTCRPRDGLPPARLGQPRRARAPAHGRHGGDELGRSGPAGAKWHIPTGTTRHARLRRPATPPKGGERGGAPS